MSHLDVLDDALIALAVCLHPHGPACVCADCQACQGARALVPRLAHVLAILTAWSRGEAEEPLVPEDLTYLLDVVLADDHPAAPPGRHQGPVPRAGEGGGMSAARRRWTETDLRTLLRARVARATLTQVAQDLGISAPYLCDIVHGRRAISATLAHRLGWQKEVTFVPRAPAPPPAGEGEA